MHHPSVHQNPRHQNHQHPQILQESSQKNPPESSQKKKSLFDQATLAAVHRAHALRNAPRSARTPLSAALSGAGGAWTTVA